MKKGFTLVELVIVIVIVGILSIVAVPIYRGYTRKAMGTEAKSLLGSIQTAQKVYYAENASFLTLASASFDEALDVDARSNKYFKKFKIEATAKDGVSGFKASTTGDTSTAASGISMTLTAYKSGEPEWKDNGLNS